MNIMRVQKKFHYIYKTTCNINGKYYIGMHSTDNLDDGYLGSGKRLWNSIKYHGEKNHTKIIIEFCENREDLKRREKEIVNDKLINEYLCMNLKPGGYGGFCNEQHRQKFISSNVVKQAHERIKWLYKNDSEWLQQMKVKIKEGQNKINFNYNTFEGRSHTEETKRKISEKNKLNQKGQKNSQYGTCWITNGVENKKIKKEELDKYIYLGWLKGRKIK